MRVPLRVPVRVHLKLPLGVSEIGFQEGSRRDRATTVCR